MKITTNLGNTLCIVLRHTPTQQDHVLILKGEYEVHSFICHTSTPEGIYYEKIEEDDVVKSKIDEFILERNPTVTSQETI